ncbi:MAG: ATP synthase F0 subunit B [Bacteriovoracia bacterium]
MDQLQEIAGQLGIDSSFYIMFGTIVLLYFLLSFTYLKPYQSLFDKRKDQTEGQKKRAQDLLSVSEKKFEEYRQKLKASTEEARQIYLAAEEAAKKEENRILSEAGEKARKNLKDTQIELEKERASVLQTLSKELSVFAEQIATKVLGRPMSK